LHRLPLAQFPLLRSLASTLADYDGAAELERGLEILLAGLKTTLTLPKATIRDKRHGATKRPSEP